MFRAGPFDDGGSRRPGHVPIGDPTDRAAAIAVQPHLAVGGVEPQRRREPHFHEVGRLEDGVGHAGRLQRSFDGALGDSQRELDTWVLAKRDEDEAIDACLARRLDQRQLALLVNAFDRVARLTRQRRRCR